MAMNYAWQERKKFAIPVGAGVAALLIWYLFILSPINRNADNDVKNRRTAELQLRSLMQAGVPTDESVGRAERDRATFQKDLKDIREKLAFRVEEGFRAKEGQSTATKFGAKRQEVFRQIDDLRTKKALEPIDSKLGFPQTFAAMPDPVLAEWLVRLAVVQRVCLLSLDCDVLSLKLIEVVAPDEPAATAADRFLNVLTVKFKVTGSAATILKLVHGLQVEGPQYLALEACSVTSADSTRNLLGCELTVGALVVRPEGTLVTEAKP